MTIYGDFDQAALDLEYSPSSCVGDINVYLDDYLRLSESARGAALANHSFLPDLRYGPGEEETLDFFQPENSSAPALHVFIHGGYWQLLSKNESSFAAPMFQHAGSCFAAVNYTLAPEQSLGGIVEENRRAIAWLYKNADTLGFDSERIFVSGSSAGAHLAMMLLLTDWTSYAVPENVIKGVCAVSGVYDLEPVRLSYVNNVVGMNSDEAWRNSPIHHTLRNHCPVILAYGDNETREFKRQSSEFVPLLREAGIPVTLHEVSNRNHFDVILDLTDKESWLSRQVLTQMGID